MLWFQQISAFQLQSMRTNYMPYPCYYKNVVFQWGSEVHPVKSFRRSMNIAIPTTFSQRFDDLCCFDLFTIKLLTCGDRVISVKLGQYHGCWCPSYLRRQDISSHDVDHVDYVGSCLIWGRISTTCVVSMWRNDIKCEYMFIFPLKNLACKGMYSLWLILHGSRWN